MRAPHTPPSGPIKTSEAIDCLALTLNVNPVDDIAITAWAAERQAILQVMRKESATGDPDWLRRFGDVNPEVHKPVVVGAPIVATYTMPVMHCARPHETRMDAANTLLLRAHPILRNAPLHFAMLEALYGLDSMETVRFPSPKTWREQPEVAEQQRATVRRRALYRIRRAEQGLGELIVHS